jgi:hypothetical protein
MRKIMQLPNAQSKTIKNNSSLELKRESSKNMSPVTSVHNLTKSGRPSQNDIAQNQPPVEPLYK